MFFEHPACCRMLKKYRINTNGGIVFFHKMEYTFLQTCARYGESIIRKKDCFMRENEPLNQAETEKKPRETDHPWVDLPVEDDSLGESVRYSLDEIRYA